MAKIDKDYPITDLTEDWEGHSGDQVQKFLKGKLEVLFGSEEGVNITNLDGYERKTGWINSSNEWNNTDTDKYKFAVIPVDGSMGLKLSVKIGAANMRYAVLKEYPNTDVNPIFTKDESFQGNLTISGEVKDRALPQDAKYVIVWETSNGNNIAPSDFVITSDQVASIGKIKEIEKSIEELPNEVSVNAIVKDGVKIASIVVDGVNTDLFAPVGSESGSGSEEKDLTNIYDISDVSTTSNGWINSSKVWSNVGDAKYIYAYIKLEASAKLTIKAGSRGGKYAVLNTYPTAVVAGEVPDFADGFDGLINIPINGTIKDIALPDTGYLLVWISNSGGSLAPVEFSLVYKNASGNTGKYKPSRWLAFGDSITECWVSWYDEEGNPQNSGGSAGRDKVYCAKVAEMTGKTLTNKGKGGEGWDCQATSSTDNPEHGARGRIDTLIAEGFDFTAYDLVTFAYGINDYKGTTPLGSMEDDVNSTYSVIANMRHCIEAVVEKNPFAKIMIITPLNARGYTNQRLGDESTNYAIGYSKHGYTLAQMFDAIVEVCKFYGIQYIDMTYRSPINRLNMVQTLPDGVHPSEDAHTIIARQVSQELTFL